jgi:hypothetical protein
MLAEGKSLEIWKFGEYRAYQIAKSGVGETKQQGTREDAARRLLKLLEEQVNRRCRARYLVAGAGT